MTTEHGRFPGWLWSVGLGVGVVAALAVGLVVGYWLFAGPAGPAPAPPGAAQAGKGPTLWTCSMHPQIKLPAAGLCPICSMELIPLEADQAEPGSLRELTVSPNARALMDIRTVPVERRFVEAEVRMVGKVDYDETRLKYITAWVPGRLDRLYVDYTGVPVRKGDHMVSLYSPELFTAQEELLQALQTVRNLKDSNVGIVREISQATVEAAREKLRLLGLKAEQVAEIEQRGKATDHMTIYSPIGGIVIHKNAQEGMYVNTGTRIYTVADLSQVWVQLDAYESDLMWLRYGQTVEFTTEAHPGEAFTGSVAFIDPVLSQATRTVKVRVNAANPQMSLKPGLFVRAVVRAKVATAGRVMDAALAGKWMCPMHPDVVKDQADKCDICEMPLVRTESLGYVGIDPAKADKPLVIPVSAALVTGGREAGSRAVVYLDIDPSLLRPTAVRSWQGLLATIRKRLQPPPNPQGFANLRCPIMGTELNLTKVPEALTRSYQGSKVAFCCAGCPEKWDALPDAGKQAKLAAASSQRTPFRHLWGLLSHELRAGLLAGDPNAAPSLDLQERFCREVNGLLEGAGLYDEAAWGGIELSQEAAGLLKHGPDVLAPRERTRLHRLLLEQTFPDELARARNAPTFEGREVVLGPRAGGYYLVRHGLAEGERVVENGSFKLDAELQIKARPSMMTPEGGGAAEKAQETGMPLPAGVRQELLAILAAAKDVRKALDAGQLAAVRSAFATLGEKVRAVHGGELTGRRRLLWNEYSMLLTNDAVEGKLVRTPDEAKRVAALLNEHAASLDDRFGLSSRHEAAPGPPPPKEFHAQLGKVIDGYLAVQQALAGDKLPEAAGAARQAGVALAAVDMKLLAGKIHEAWMKALPGLRNSLAGIESAKEVSAAREAFALLSEELAATARRFGPLDRALYQLQCPMAFDNRGATWLQADEKVRNPYFGAAMPACGTVIQVLPAAKQEAAPHE